MKLTQQGIDTYEKLRQSAITAVSERFYAAHEAQYRQFGEAGRTFCQQDIEFHLKFLRPALEFDDLEPFVEYLRWLNDVLKVRNIPTEHLAQTLQWLGEFFHDQMADSDGLLIETALRSATDKLIQLPTAEQPS